jgi:ankyrin repeat protein
MDLFQNYQKSLEKSEFSIAKAIIFKTLRDNYTELPYQYLRFFLPTVLKRFIPKSILDSQDQSKNTFLHLTISALNYQNLTDKYCENIEEMVLTLLKFGATPNSQGSSKNTPLHLAIIFQNPRIISHLCNYGADINLTNAWCYSPYDFAFIANSHLCTRVLLEESSARWWFERKLEFGFVFLLVVLSYIFAF